LIEDLAKDSSKNSLSLQSEQNVASLSLESNKISKKGKDKSD